MTNLFYYNSSTEYLDERQLLSRFPVEELRQYIRDYSWEYISGITNVPIPVINRLFIYDYEEIPKVVKVSDRLYQKIIELNNSNVPYWVRRESIAYMPDELADVAPTFLSDKFYGRINFAFLYSDYIKNANSSPRSVTVYSLAYSDFDPNGPYQQVPDWKSKAYAPTTAIEWESERGSFEEIIRVG